MDDVHSLNPLAQRAWTALITAYPDWAQYFGTHGEGDLEAAIPAPSGSSAGYLVVFTAKGQNLWIRFSPPSMCYSVDDETEMIAVVRQLMTEEAMFVVIKSGDEWVGTTLIRRDEAHSLPQLERNQATQSFRGQENTTKQSLPQNRHRSTKWTSSWQLGS